MARMLSSVLPVHLEVVWRANVVVALMGYMAILDTI